jgi:uncharacterized protein
MQTIIITGGTGLVGRALTRHLSAKGYDIIILTRDPHIKKGIPGISYAAWDLKKRYIDPKAIQRADHIIHLAGASIFSKRWTTAYKKEILDSRVGSSKLIIDTLKNTPHHIKSLISASAIGIYGTEASATHYFTETERPATDFLGNVCRLWEESILPARELGIRTCSIRTGIVLSNDGGALTEMRRPLKFGVAAIVGNGNQIISWVHIEDLCRIYTSAIENGNMTGAYNATAPIPATNKELTLMLARKVRRNFFVPVHIPSFMIRIILDGSGNEALKSSKVSPDKIKREGFHFLFPSVESALGDLIR